MRHFLEVLKTLLHLQRQCFQIFFGERKWHLDESSHDLVAALFARMIVKGARHICSVGLQC